jgi:proteasome lid subunit RPN8/RPN11
MNPRQASGPGKRDASLSKTTVSLPKLVETAMVAHARRVAPEECCGLLVGGLDYVADAVPASNVADDPARRYLIDPLEYLRALRAARIRGLQVIGAYHSHPSTPATPSETDAAQGFGEFLYIIVGLGVDPPEVTGWRWAGGNFAQVSLVRLPEGKG